MANCLFLRITVCLCLVVTNTLQWPLRFLLSRIHERYLYTNMVLGLLGLRLAGGGSKLIFHIRIYLLLEVVASWSFILGYISVAGGGSKWSFILGYISVAGGGSKLIIHIRIYLLLEVVASWSFILGYISVAGGGSKLIFHIRLYLCCWRW